MAIRNPPADRTETASSSVSTEGSVSVPAVEEPVPLPSESDHEDEELITVTPSETEKNQNKDKKGDAGHYGRGKERYTIFDAEDVFTKVNVKIANEKDLRAVTGASYDTVKSYLNTYASHNGVEATRCRMLAHQKIGELGDRIEIYMRFNDEEKTLVTVIFEPANSVHSSHVDVVPCQYTVKEIKRLNGNNCL